MTSSSSSKKNQQCFAVNPIPHQGQGHFQKRRGWAVANAFGTACVRWHGMAWHGMARGLVRHCMQCRGEVVQTRHSWSCVWCWVSHRLRLSRLMTVPEKVFFDASSAASSCGKECTFHQSARALQVASERAATAISNSPTCTRPPPAPPTTHLQLTLSCLFIRPPLILVNVPRSTIDLLHNILLGLLGGAHGRGIRCFRENTHTAAYKGPDHRARTCRTEVLDRREEGSATACQERIPPSLPLPLALSVPLHLYCRESCERPGVDPVGS
jgi:hypothetical protein